MSAASQSWIDIRSTIPQWRRKEASDLASDRFANLENLTLSFASMGTEIDLWPLNRLLAKRGFLALPRVEGMHLICYLVTDLDALVLSKWGVLEPNPKRCIKIDSEKLTAILVPGLAFDANHHRKGYGKGYYDRFLKKVSGTLTIGMGFREQFSQTPLPIHEGDVSLESLSLF